MKRSARMAAFLLAAALSAAPCLAEFTPVEVPQATNTSAAPEAMENVPQITEKGLTLGNNSVKYPEITGMADESIQQQVNDAILQAGKIENRLSRMAVLMSSPVPLTVTYSAALADDVLSVAILSSGALETERATQEWAAVNIDLRTGQEITFDDLFTDADEARAKMEETIADEILPDMSAHLAAAELLPLPPRPKRRMEVYGDSVSAGEVSEAEFACGQVDPEGHNGRYSNGYLSYSWQTARLLGAELHDIATGGMALEDGTGYFYSPDYIGMLSSWDKINYYPPFGAKTEWDFSRYTPHVVVTAIGQNDANPVNFMAQNYDCDASKHWRSAYAGWIRAIRAKYPHAQIILTTTILGHDAAWDRAIDEVCRELSKTDGRVHHFLYSKNGCGTPGHIRGSEAAGMAKELAGFIETLPDVWED